MRGKADAQSLRDNFLDGTQALYRSEFGDYIYQLR
jgi:hypothetical protein